jgi:hypothetical protein
MSPTAFWGLTLRPEKKQSIERTGIISVSAELSMKWISVLLVLCFIGQVCTVCFVKVIRHIWFTKAIDISNTSHLTVLQIMC